MDRGFTELIAKGVRTRSGVEYLRGVALGSRDTKPENISYSRLTSSFVG